MRGFRMAAVAAVMVCSAAVAAEPRTPVGPLAPDAALRAFVLDPGLQIELVAAEPQVVDPVAVQFGVDGALWVVEMRDYPYGPKDGGPPRSRIVRLTDADRDGRYETSTVFADELLFATGLLPYRDGLIVTLAGQIAFFADRDGDGRAEFRETWFSGFAQENSQLRANHPTFGPDGYVYVANGLRGGKIVAERPSWKRNGDPLVITGFDFRFHPETGDFSTVTGHGQFGLTFDDFGRRFVCSNRNPCQHVVLEDVYLKRNPAFAAKAVMHDVATPAEKSRLYPISQAWTTSTLHANQFTAACGVTIYRGDALPAEYQGNVFTCDPTGNLVHREIVAPQGATFASRSPYEGREFLASPDTWFRPVNLANGPDGALYVVDMYRAVIEHPDWMPAELKTRPDLLLGNEQGRIYRVTRRGTRPDARRELPGARRQPQQLVELLSHPNGWQRDAALRLLVEQKDAAPTAALRDAVRNSATAAGRAQALWTLQQVGALPPQDLQAVLQHDPAPELREWALRLADAAPEAAFDVNREIQRELAAGASPRVRFQWALHLALLPSAPALLDPLAQLSASAAADGADPWERAAVLIAARDQAGPLLTRLLKDRGADAAARPGLPDLAEQLAELSATQAPDAAGALVQAASALPASAASDEVRWAVLRGVGAGWQRKGKSLAAAQELQAQTADWFRAAAAAAQDAAHHDRFTPLRTLRFAAADIATPVLLRLALEDPDSALQTAAFETLATFPQADFAAPLVERFPAAVPAVRRAILDTLLASDSRLPALFDALERGDVKPAELDPVRQARLTKHRTPEVRERAQKLFAAASADRAAVLADYERSLSLPADPLRGRAIFEKQCVTCHRIANLGVNVGPDIGDTRDKTPAYLLTSILDPNRVVDNNSFAYTVVTNQGKVLTGLIASESSASITLKQPEGKTETVLRTDIEELKSTGQSLMPVGFEKNVTPEQMADLISFLKNWRYLDGAVPGVVGASGGK